MGAVGSSLSLFQQKPSLTDRLRGDGATSVSLIHCDISDDSGLDEVVQELLHPANTVTDLNLGHNRIGDSGIASLAKVLSQNKNIRILRLSCNQFGDSGIACIAGALQGNTNLLLLDVGFNVNVTDSGAAILAQVLSSSNQTLRALGLSGTQVTVEGAKSLSSVLAKGRLSSLWLTSCEIGDEGITHLANALCSPEAKLDELKVDGCSLTEDGMIALVKVFDDSITIEAKIPRSTSARSEAQVEVDKARKAAPKKTHAKITLFEDASESDQDEDDRDSNQDLHHSSTSSSSSPTSCSRRPPCLKALCLDDNPAIGDCGVLKLITTLSACFHSQLETLSLSNCGVSNAAALKLAECLVLSTFLPSLIELDLSRNLEVNRSAQITLFNALHQRKKSHPQLPLIKFSRPCDDDEEEYPIDETSESLKMKSADDAAAELNVLLKAGSSNAR